VKFRDVSELSGPSNFVKLKDGESIAGICRGEIEDGFVVWENKTKTPVPEGTPGARFNFKVNFVVKEGTSYVAKVLEGGVQIYSQLAKLSKEWDLPETVIFISREGSGQNDTEYTVMPAPPKQQVTKEALEFISAMELNDLGPKAEQKEVKNHAPGSNGKRY
jgi:hypothetical protein